jgi:hypothetical protein
MINRHHALTKQMDSKQAGFIRKQYGKHTAGKEITVLAAPRIDLQSGIFRR